MSRNTSRPLGLVIILSLPTAVPQKSTVLGSVHTVKSFVTTQLYYYLFALESLFLPGIEQHFLSRKMFSQSLRKKRQQNKARLAFKKSDSMDFLAIIRCCLSVFSQAVHLRPHWRCGQFACNKIFLHPPYKMKQHILYSLIVRPRKSVCGSQYYR